MANANKAYESGDYMAALTLLSSMVDDGADTAVLTLLGQSFQKLGLEKDALDLFSRAVNLDPTPAALQRAALSAVAVGDDARALLYGMRLFVIEPDNAPVAALVAATFIRSGDPASAQLVRSALVESEDPAHIHLAAELYAEENRDPAALTVYRKLARLNPDDPYAQATYMAIARDFCDYDALADLERRWETASWDTTTATPRLLEAETAYANLLHCDNERLNRLATNGTSRDRSKPAFSGRPLMSRKRGTQPLRIGYLSSDFWSGHATMRLLQAVLTLHDRNRFDVTLYCHTPEEFTQIDSCDRTLWGRIVPIHALSDAEAARKIRADGIDILVDLKGSTSGNRGAILNENVAAVQIAWLGFPGSNIGIDCDYVIGDPIVTPPTSAPVYHEQICRLPETYQPNDPFHRALPPATPRAALGLPEDRFVFAAFNVMRKMTIGTIDIWAEILRQAPEVLLWVLVDGDIARENFRRAMASRGVDETQIVFAAKASYETHIARLQAADLGLDTFPYNGHTTTSDQLWAGLPVITMRGRNFASRVSESLLTAIGLPDLVLPDRQALIDRAVALARHPQEIASLRQRLVDNRDCAPLFDAERFCRHLEAAYERMADRARLRLPPASFDVPALPKRTGPFR
ncbi:glycosyl transferase [Rhizobium sp. DKSPLA3]|uniref:protein O-GlcNAc transferase n=1 Tax=Rhizobium quercicola TaxID=2901226 RepID=A0A9X1T0W4_9HYPH|nr:glycosyl transferase [Rhizobium quercicola]MCD7109916.1 glycosyl transferase [Rhizobium quercicola]